MGARDSETDDTDQDRTGADSTSRRTLLKTAAVVGATAGLGGVAMAQSGGGALESTTMEFGGEVSGWHGRAPSSIEGETNPTLVLEAGTEYTVTWENTDGQPHNFQMLDSDDNVLHESEIISEQGATQTTSFTATSEMTQYNCVVHPSSMLGSVEIEGQSGSSANGTNESNDSDNETAQSGVNQSPNRSTNESGGLDAWNVTGNGSAEPGVVDNASANTNGTAGNATMETTNATTMGATGSTTQEATESGTTAEASTTGSDSDTTEENDDTSGSGGETTTGGSGPGFGALAALGGLTVGAARLLVGRDD